ncbi:MAG TPA: FAD/NAD(P)-binding protein [Symbiobacteriaceae bacterium]|nr:FAD/NAD(P)-binding protein [Symbiobacteriaceae bacterium]
MRKEFTPVPARILKVSRQTYDTLTYTVAFEDPDIRADYRFQPGQFNMISLLGIGEAPISISSWHGDTATFDHTIRAVGTVTRALEGLKEGDRLWVRGPYGHGWPVEDVKGKNVLLIAGGIGLAPLRPLIQEMIRRPDRYGHLEILYGARTMADQLFTSEFAEWERYPNLTLRLASDRPAAGFPGRVGPVTVLFEEMTSKPQDTIVVTCGPEVMMKYVVRGLLARGFTPTQIYVSLERRMECGFGKCGHCQIGPLYVCKDGPVFRYTDIRNLPEEVF